MIRTEIAGEELTLLPERAAFWKRTRTLFVADFHLGKAASFRKAGIPIPTGTTSENVDRLERCLERQGATRLVFLGDFLHSAEGRAERTLARFGEWRESRKDLDIVLVRGNHDDRAGDPPVEWGIRCVNPGEAMAPFALVHEPKAVRGGYALAGHIHPAVRLAGGLGESVRLPCFWFGPRVGVLPSFGAFTGSAVVRPKAGDRVFVLAEGEVIEVGARR